MSIITLDGHTCSAGVNVQKVRGMDETGGTTRPIVIVDAFADEREMYEETLRYGGYDVIACEKLEDTLRFVREAGVAAVITRITQGPGVEWNGVELTGRLKGDDRTKHIPVIVLTTRIEPQWRVAAEQAGCDSFLMLPCAPETLLSEVRRVTAARPRRDAASRASAGDSRLVWRLFSPTGRQLRCEMRRHGERFELFIADDRDEPIVRTTSRS